MQIFSRIPNSVKGIFFIVGGALVLCNTLGFTIEIIRTLVIIGSVCAILFGMYLANIHTYILQLLNKQSSSNNDSNNQPPSYH